MDGTPGPQDDRASWIRSRSEQGFGRYLGVLRERVRLILAITAICLIAAAVYVASAPKQYQTQADLLVTPAPDTLLPEQSLLRDSSDPTVDVQSVALLVTSEDVASLARAALGYRESVATLLGDVQAAPVAGSTLVAVTAQADTPVRAQEIANAFAAATVLHGTTQLQTALSAEAAHLQAQIAALPRGEPPSVVNALAQALTSIETMQGAQDPTLRVAAQAALPTAVASPRPLRSLGVALLAGLVLGVGVALAFHGLDPVLRHEDQLEARYTLPVLARIPAAGGRQPTWLARWLGGRSSPAGPLVPGREPPAMIDAYRSLVPVLAAITRSASMRSEPRSIAVTSASASEGKTTTAISLAWSLAAAGHRVILIEADFRHPAIGQALRISSHVGTGTLLDSATADMFRRPRTQETLEDALVRTRLHGVEFEVLLAGNAPLTGATVFDRLSGGGAGALISLARERADFIVIDSPGLNEAMETLPLAQAADELLLVVALGKTRVARLDHLGELLLRYDVRPAGFVVVGVDRGGLRRAYPAERADGRTLAEAALATRFRAALRGLRAPAPARVAQDPGAPGSAGPADETPLA